MRSVTVAERRARLARRQYLPGPATDVTTLAGDICGLHSTNPDTVYLACMARLKGFKKADLEEALYTERSVVRMLGMRRTMFVVPRDLAAIMDNACTKALVPGERRKFVQMLADAGIAKDPRRWLRNIERKTLEALDELGEATASELAASVSGLAKKIRVGVGKKWEGDIGVSTRVLFLLATDGRILRGRPRGSWLSSQYRWVTTASWLGEELPDIDPREARAELVRRWLRCFGPGTLTDVKWWTGWTVANTKMALADVGAVEVELEPSGSGYLLPDDLEPVKSPRSWVALLPTLDPTVMGYKERDWYLGPHAPRLFDTNGNAGPTIWLDGRVVGGWGIRRGGKVVYQLLEDVPKAARGRIDDETKRLTEWLDDTTPIPRFRTPLERELSSG
jgi:hypothetical protein